MTSRKLKGFIVLHDNPDAKDSFIRDAIRLDVFVHKDHVDEFEKWRDTELYEAKDCPVVSDYIKRFRDYIYLGSEDFLHTFEVNVRILKTIIDLVKKGFEVVS